MTISQKLKEAKEELVEQRNVVSALLEKLQKGEFSEETDRPLINEKREAIKALNAKIEGYEKDLELVNEARSWNSDNTAGNAPVSVAVIKSGNLGDNEERAANEFTLIDAINAQINPNHEKRGFYNEMNQEAEIELRRLGLESTGNVRVPGKFIKRSHQRFEKRDITATTTTTGGHTVATELKGLIPFLDPRLTVLEMGATYMGGLVGNIDFPRNDAAATAVWASTENATSTETTPTFDKLSMSPKRITAFTDVSKQNLAQTSIDMENFVRERINRAVMSLLETACISGTGSSGQPSGILTISGTNDITIGTNGGLLTWAHIVQFETETTIDSADFGRLGYLFTPGVAGLLKTTKRDVAGNGFIWEGPNNGTGTVNGYRAMTSTYMPSTLTKGTSSGTCHAAIFGNWEELMIGQWGGIDLLINPYTKGKEALVEVIVNAWYDLGVRHAVSFCKCDEITLT